MRNFENVEIATEIEAIISREGEYQNENIDTNAPLFLQIARNTQDKKAVIEHITAALTNDKHEIDEIYHYLEYSEAEIASDYEFEKHTNNNVSDETANRFAAIERIITAVEDCGKKLLATISE